jgi:hypothetical protein
MEVTQQPVEPVDHPAALGGQLVAPLGEQPQNAAVVFARDAP